MTLTQNLASSVSFRSAARPGQGDAGSGHDGAGLVGDRASEGRGLPEQGNEPQEKQ